MLYAVVLHREYGTSSLRSSLYYSDVYFGVVIEDKLSKTPQKATKGHKKPLKATKSHKRPQKATKGHKKPQKVAKGHKIFVARKFREN
jgi:hypothetical protein